MDVQTISIVVAATSVVIAAIALIQQSREAKKDRQNSSCHSTPVSREGFLENTLHCGVYLRMERPSIILFVCYMKTFKRLNCNFKLELMMMEAYILVVISSQHELHGFGRSVKEKIGALKGIESVELLFGDYDAIIKVKMPKIDDIENLVIEEISLIEGVNDTITLLCVDDTIL